MACGLRRRLARAEMLSNFRSMLRNSSNGSSIERSFIRYSSAVPCPDASTGSNGVCAGLETGRSFDPTSTFFTRLTEGWYWVIPQP